MKTIKILLLIVTSMIITSCLQLVKTEVKPSQFNNTQLFDVKMVIIDGCEYIQYRTYNAYYAITPNIKPLMNKIDSLEREIVKLKKNK